MDLEKLFGATKSLAIVPRWVEMDSSGLAVVCPLDVSGEVVEGLRFRATAKKQMPDEMLTFQVEYHPPNELGGPMARIEWRPLSTHNNKGKGPAELQNRIIKGCHHHSFELNMKYAREQVCRGGNLPIAIPIHGSPEGFPALIAFVSKEFRISNLDLLEVPPWEPALF